MQIVFDFIAGDIPFDEFWDAYCADLKIGKFVMSSVFIRSLCILSSTALRIPSRMPLR